MQWTIKPASTFKKTFKRFANNQKVCDKFSELVDLLAQGDPLPQSYKDHQLSGKLKHCRECHIFPNVLLIYERRSPDLIVLLYAIGSHSDLFGK